MAEETKGTWLSPETYARLQAELEEMTTVRRAEIAQKIEAARNALLIQAYIEDEKYLQVRLQP